MTPLLSIIIPLYNNAHYITRCVESIIAQDFREDQPIEIIIVNDGSTDNAIEVVNNLQKKYDCIRLVNQENKGVSAARNRGIDEAQGKYIYFIDPDDALKSGYFSKFLKILQATKCKLLWFNYQEVDERQIDGEISVNQCVDRQINYTICTINQMTLYHHIGFTKYIYERNYLIDSKSRFRTDIMIAEDLIWLNSVLSYKKVPIVFTSEVVYLYYQNPKSVMHSNDSFILFKLANQYLNVITAYLDLLKNNNLDNIFVEYLRKGELKSISEKFIMSIYLGIININRSDILFLKENNLYPITYKNSQHMTKSQIFNVN